MFTRINIKQVFRSPVRYVATFFVIAFVCSFLTVGLNLRQIASNNTDLLQESFDVVAIPTFYATVNKNAEFVETSFDIGYLGYHKVPAEQYDLTPIREAAGVKNIFVQKQFGAYVDQAITRGVPGTETINDVFVFTYRGVDPVILAGSSDTNDAQVLDMELVWSAIGADSMPLAGDAFKIVNMTNHNYAEDRKECIETLGLNEMWIVDSEGRKDGGIVLQPGMSYIATGYWNCDIKKVSSAGTTTYTLLRNTLVIDGDLSPSKKELNYFDRAALKGWYALQKDVYHVRYPNVMPYEDGFWQSEAGDYYVDIIDVMEKNRQTLTAVATENLSMYRPFYSGDVYISEGRNFTQDDYSLGNQVCLVSAYLAELNGLKIGDTLDLSFFEATYDYTGVASDVVSTYEPMVEHQLDDETYQLEKCDCFFDHGTFEIVGFYDGNVTKSSSSRDAQYGAEEGVDRTMIFVPESAVQNIPDVPLTEYNTTILLDDEQLLFFMTEMEATDLTKTQMGAYTVEFQINDQGLAGMKQSIRQLEAVSRLTLYLACAAAAVMIITIAVLVTLQNKRQIATYRSLGVRAIQIPAAVLTGTLIVCLLGVCIGGWFGHTVSDQTAEYIVNTAQLDAADTTFSAMLAKDQVNQSEAYVIAIQSDPMIAAIAAIGVLASVLILTNILILFETRKSPMLVLGAKE